SLYTMSWNGTMLGTPQMMLMSHGENNFYPAYSSDNGAFIIFNRAMGTDDISTDAFSNPKARIWAMPAGGGNPVDLAKLNVHDNRGNSWPRWSPHVQHYKGKSILWVTFSSYRDYGLRVKNEDPNAAACYPPDSPENLDPSHTCALVPPSCGCTNMGPCPQF